MYTITGLGGRSNGFGISSSGVHASGGTCGAVSELTPERRDVLIALAAEALAGRIESAESRDTLPAPRWKRRGQVSIA